MESRDTFKHLLYEHTRTNKYMNTHIRTKPKRPKPSYKQVPKANINKFEKGNSASQRTQIQRKIKITQSSKWKTKTRD